MSAPTCLRCENRGPCEIDDSRPVACDLCLGAEVKEPPDAAYVTAHIFGGSHYGNRHLFVCASHAEALRSTHGEEIV